MQLPLRLTETARFEYADNGDAIATAFYKRRPALSIEMPWATFVASYQQAQKLMAARAEWELANPPRDNVVRFRSG